VEEYAPTGPIDAPTALTCVRTLRLKVRPESRSWLNAAAIEVNQVWNWANELSARAARVTRRERAETAGPSPAPQE
jgi:hypothetical protein